MDDKLELNYFFLRNNDIVFYPYRKAKVINIFATYHIENSESHDYITIWHMLTSNTRLKYENGELVPAPIGSIERDNHCCFKVGSGIVIGFEDDEIWFGTDIEVQ